MALEQQAGNLVEPISLGEEQMIDLLGCVLKDEVTMQLVTADVIQGKVDIPLIFGRTEADDVWYTAGRQVLRAVAGQRDEQQRL